MGIIIMKYEQKNVCKTAAILVRPQSVKSPCPCIFFPNKAIAHAIYYKALVPSFIYTWGSVFILFHKGAFNIPDS